MRLPEEIVIQIIDHLADDHAFGSIAALAQCDRSSRALCDSRLYRDIHLTSDSQIRRLVDGMFPIVLFPSSSPLAEDTQDDNSLSNSEMALKARRQHFRDTKSITFDFFPHLSTLRYLQAALNGATSLLFPNATDLILTKSATATLQSASAWHYIELKDNPVGVFANLISPVNFEIHIGKRHLLFDGSEDYAINAILTLMTETWDRLEVITCKGEPCHIINGNCPQLERKHIHRLVLSVLSDKYHSKEVEVQATMETLKKLITGLFWISASTHGCSEEVILTGDDEVIAAVVIMLEKTLNSDDGMFDILKTVCG